MEAPRLDANYSYQSLSVGDMMRPQLVGGKLALPVENYTPFVNFKYVQAVPAGNSAGFSVSKLAILDALIAQLVQTKAKSEVGEVPANAEALDSKQIDALINKLAHSLKTAVSSGTQELPVAIGAEFGMAQSQTGTLVSVLA